MKLSTMLILGGGAYYLWTRHKSVVLEAASSTPLSGVWWSYEITKLPDDTFVVSLYPPQGEKLVLPETYATDELASAAAKLYIIGQGGKPYARN